MNLMYLMDVIVSLPPGNVIVISSYCHALLEHHGIVRLNDDAYTKKIMFILNAVGGI